MPEKLGLKPFSLREKVAESRMRKSVPAEQILAGATPLTPTLSRREREKEADSLR
jgi:hypothetical protein